MSANPLHAAAEVVADGGIISYPTESCFGLGCDPRNEQALARLLKLKRRDWKKGLIVIAADFSQLSTLLLPVNDSDRHRLEQSWPGPVTWLMPCKPSLSRRLRGEHCTLAVRITAHPIARRLCQLVHGPLVSTSANYPGEPALLSVAATERRFNDRVDFYLNGRLGDRVRPSEIRDLLTNSIIRAA